MQFSSINKFKLFEKEVIPLLPSKFKDLRIFEFYKNIIETQNKNINELIAKNKNLEEKLEKLHKNNTYSNILNTTDLNNQNITNNVITKTQYDDIIVQLKSELDIEKAKYIELINTKVNNDPTTNPKFEQLANDYKELSDNGINDICDYIKKIHQNLDDSILYQFLLDYLIINCYDKLKIINDNIHILDSKNANILSNKLRKLLDYDFNEKFEIINFVKLVIEIENSQPQIIFINPKKKTKYDSIYHQLESGSIKISNVITPGISAATYVLVKAIVTLDCQSKDVVPTKTLIESTSKESNTSIGKPSKYEIQKYSQIILDVNRLKKNFETVMVELEDKYKVSNLDSIDINSILYDYLLFNFNNRLMEFAPPNKNYNSMYIYLIKYIEKKIKSSYEAEPNFKILFMYALEFHEIITSLNLALITKTRNFDDTMHILKQQKIKVTFPGIMTPYGDILVKAIVEVSS